MPAVSCRFSFDIAEWHASSDRLADDAQWQAWAKAPQSFDLTAEHKPALAFLPAMQRRRLSRSARLVCDAAWALADRHPAAPLVYASHDGELNRSFELWLELMKSGTVSPTSFGLSVHNALAGQWAVLRGDMRENTALAVGADGLEAALAETCALLEEGAESVLLVIADDPLSDGYAVKAERAPFAYALAMVVTKGSRYTLALTDRPSENLPEAPYWGALDWIRFMLADGSEAIRNYGTRTWIWSKQP
ncbi:beta-ketoacyl synthase chain length factor [Bergeriella denitrificans]|uniref:Beta-ketoacyl synthase-like N-terminal domain-containing protein n=1 Tax=Bergeriella denitrificans TaxID=494 RepID=A0A378UES8_BERDE|nr:beta-ketoacyl synthase chain length factor [Bergeriella denitrificans]STZ75700.1 Uncharacterised protein [Bergeriella denitrificans]